MMLRGLLLGTVCALFLVPATGRANPNLIQAQYQPSPGYGQDWQGRREHCWRMRGRLHEIRDRMQYAPPWERDRLGYRFSEIRERLRQECWGHWREGE